MKTKLFLFITGMLCINTYAQITFHDHIITNTEEASSVYAIDIDGDGDMDVLAELWDDNIVWYENDGLGNFGENIIITNVFGLREIYFGDLDGDGDIDVLFATHLDPSSNDPDKIAWIENIDGLGNFGPEQLITINVDLPRAVLATDIDGDGDLDVLSASQVDHKIAWYENDGLGNFGPQQIIINEQWYGYNVTTGDIDGDGDMDVLAVIAFNSITVWFENTDGQGSFGPQHIITEDLGGSVRPCDLDLDGDLDVIFNYVISGDRRLTILVWYENIDGLGSFGNYQVITNNNGGGGVPTDIDGDGDKDVLSSFEGAIVWYENIDGLGSFGNYQVITELSGGGFPADINGDGDMDVLSRFVDGIAWFENMGILAVNENTSAEFTVYPIPTTGRLTIESKTPITQIEVYNQLGQLVMSNKYHPPAGRAGNTIDISSINQGVYFVKIKGENGTIGTQKVVKK